jgi:hypothetical protein
MTDALVGLRVSDEASASGWTWNEHHENAYDPRGVSLSSSLRSARAGARISELHRASARADRRAFRRREGHPWPVLAAEVTREVEAPDY